MPGGSWSPGDYAVGNDIYRKSLPAGAPPATGGAVPSGLIDKTAANLQSAANGELPPDVVEQLRRHAAEFGVAAGLPGSEFSGYQGLKQLGLTSLARQDMATQATLPWFMTPQQISQQTLQNRQIGLANDAAIYARNRDLQDRSAAAWNAGRIDPWARTGSTPMMGMAPSGVNYGGPPGGLKAATNPTPDYSGDVGNFIQKYLPGAANRGAFTFQGGDIGDTAPVNLNSGVTSTNLAPQQNFDWEAGGDWSQGEDSSFWE